VGHAPGPEVRGRDRDGDVQVIVSGTKELAATRQTVWGVINEPAELAKLMPGVESFEISDERHWSAKVKVPLGLGGLKMTMNFEKLEEREPEFASMRAKGQGVGALMDMTTSFTLSEVEGGTSMMWEADVKIAGPVGAMGQRVLQPIVNQQVSQVLEALERRVEETESTTGGAEAGIHPASPEVYEAEPEGPTQNASS
jgi:carbon monoxide dehydrogenase subunit G